MATKKTTLTVIPGGKSKGPEFGNPEWLIIDQNHEAMLQAHENECLRQGISPTSSARPPMKLEYNERDWKFLAEKHGMKPILLRGLNEDPNYKDDPINHKYAKYPLTTAGTDGWNKVDWQAAKSPNPMNLCIGFGYWAGVSPANMLKCYAVVDVDKGGFESVEMIVRYLGKPLFGYETTKDHYHLWYVSEKRFNNKVIGFKEKLGELRCANGYVAIHNMKALAFGFRNARTTKVRLTEKKLDKVRFKRLGPKFFLKDYQEIIGKWATLDKEEKTGMPFRLGWCCGYDDNETTLNVFKEIAEKRRKEVGEDAHHTEESLSKAIENGWRSGTRCKSGRQQKLDVDLLLSAFTALGVEIRTVIGVGSEDQRGQKQILGRLGKNRNVKNWMPLSDEGDESLLENRVRHECGIDFTDGGWTKSLKGAFAERKINPFLEYYNSLPMAENGTPTLDNLFTMLFKVKNAKKNKHLIKFAGRFMGAFLGGSLTQDPRWNPFDTFVLVLRGEHRIGKGNSWQKLFPPDMQDNLFLPGFEWSWKTKDMNEILGDAKIAEWPEFAGFNVENPREVNRFKAYITRGRDKYRPAYGREAITQERCLLFIVTVNGKFAPRDEAFMRRCIYLEVAPKYDGKGKRILPHEVLDKVRDSFWSETKLVLSGEGAGGLPVQSTEYTFDVEREQFAAMESAIEGTSEENDILDYFDDALNNRKGKVVGLDVGNKRLKPFILTELLDAMGHDAKSDETKRVVGAYSNKDKSPYRRALEHLGYKYANVMKEGKQKRRFIPPQEQKRWMIELDENLSSEKKPKHTKNMRLKRWNARTGESR